jgi:hypothetical protein
MSERELDLAPETNKKMEVISVDLKAHKSLQEHCVIVVTVPQRIAEQIYKEIQALCKRSEKDLEWAKFAREHGREVRDALHGIDRHPKK